MDVSLLAKDVSGRESIYPRPPIREGGSKDRASSLAVTAISNASGIMSEATARIPVTPLAESGTAAAEKAQATSGSTFRFPEVSSSRADGTIWLFKEAMRVHDFALLTTLLEKHPDLPVVDKILLLSQIIENYDSLLSTASSTEILNTLDALLKNGPMGQKAKEMALIAAAREGHIHLMTKLLAHGPYSDKIIQSIIVDAAKKNDLPVLNLLISSEKDRAVALIELSKLGFKDSIKILMKTEHLPMTARIEVAKALKAAGMVTEARLLINKDLGIDGLIRMKTAVDETASHSVSPYLTRLADSEPLSRERLKELEAYSSEYRGELVLAALECGFPDIAISLVHAGPVSTKALNSALITSLKMSSFELFIGIISAVDHVDSSRNVVSGSTCFRGILHVIQHSDFTAEESAFIAKALFERSEMTPADRDYLINAALTSEKLFIARALGYSKLFVIDDLDTAKFS